MTSIVEEILDRSRIYPDQSITVKAFAETWLIPDQHDYVVVDQGKLAGSGVAQHVALPPAERVGDHPTRAG